MDGRRKQVHFSKRTIRTICQVMTLLMVLAMIPAIAPKRAEAAVQSESSNFLMYIEKAEKLGDRGTLLSGKVEKGSVYKGCTLIFAGSDSNGDPLNISVTVKGMNKDVTTITSAKKGDEIGILVDNVAPSSVTKGDALISDNNSPYVNHRGMICGSLQAYNGGYSFSSNETVIFHNSKASLSVECVESVFGFARYDEKNVWVFFKNPTRAHVYQIGEKYNVIIESRKVATFTVKHIVDSAACTIVMDEYDRIRYGTVPIDLSDFSDPSTQYAWIPSEEDRYVHSMSGNSGRNNTTSTLNYTPYFQNEITICFDCKAKPDGTGDKCNFIVDGKPMFSYTVDQNGWKYHKYVLSAGSHTLTWEYVKDGVSGTGDDYFAIRNLCAYESYPFILDANGGTFSGGEKQVTQYVSYLAEYCRFSSTVVPNPTRYGYTFRGYTEDPEHLRFEATNVRWKSQGEDFEPVTYYAIWEKDDYNIVADLDFQDDGLWKIIDSNHDEHTWDFGYGIFTNELSGGSEIINEEGPGYLGVDCDEWAVSPGVKLGNLKYSFRFWGRNFKNVSVYVGTSRDPAKMKKVADFRDQNTEDLTEYMVPLDGYENKTVYIAFRHYYPNHAGESVDRIASELTIERPRVVEEFSDVRAGSNKGSDTYYYSPVYWARENGITMGVKGKDGVYRTFNPTGNCTRAQMVTFLWRMADCPEPTKLTNYPDVDKNSYYYKAVCWAQEKGITEGYPDGTFKPQNPCDRKQAVTFLWRFAGKPIESQISNFPDVEPGTYYYDAVNWAATYEITTGYPDGTFKPTNKCSRSQMVTFLYRYSGIPKG